MRNYSAGNLRNTISDLLHCGVYLKNKKGDKQPSNSKETFLMICRQHGKMGRRKTRGLKQAGRISERQDIYREVMSLSAWSSSSLMALYLSFWAYNSSAGQRSTGSAGRHQEQQRHKSRTRTWTGGEKRQEREEKTKHTEVRRLRGRNVSLLPADGWD